MKLNTNCLAGYRCPKCGSPGPFRMTVTVAADVSDEGFEDIHGNFEFVAGSHTRCHACQHSGPLEEFDIQNRYIKAGGIYCPYCGSEEIEGRIVEVDQGIARQEIRCVECRADWQDQYRLIAICNCPDHDRGNPT